MIRKPRQRAEVLTQAPPSVARIDESDPSSVVESLESAVRAIRAQSVASAKELARTRADMDADREISPVNTPGLDDAVDPVSGSLLMENVQASVHQLAASCSVRLLELQRRIDENLRVARARVSTIDSEVGELRARHALAKQAAQAQADTPYELKSQRVESELVDANRVLEQALFQRNELHEIVETQMAREGSVEALKSELPARVSVSVSEIKSAADTAFRGTYGARLVELRNQERKEAKVATKAERRPRWVPAVLAAAAVVVMTGGLWFGGVIGPGQDTNVSAPTISTHKEQVR